MERVRVGIVGGSGYGGRELLRILGHHPGARVVGVTSRSRAGRPVAEAHEELAGICELSFTYRAPEELAQEVDCLFFALPHGEAGKRMEAVVEAAPEVRIVDLSGDFRLPRAGEWEMAYGAPHPCPEIVPEFVYGLPEIARETTRAARRVANPGCFATAMLLALAPFADAGILPPDVIISGVTGSSGSGAQPKATTHHPERAEDFRAYRPLRHQHVPEVEAALRGMGAGRTGVTMVPHSAPYVRGIFVTAYFLFEEPVAPDRLRAMIAGRCEEEPFLRLRETTPRVAVVRGTNFCDLSLATDGEGRRAVVMAAIDNLGKGMAGQAVQNMNLIFGMPETEGLL